MAVVTLQALISSTGANSLNSSSSSATKLVKALNAIRGAFADGKVKVYVESDTSSTLAPASGTITLTYASIANNDTVTIGGVVLTCVTGTPTGAQFKKVTDATATAANLAAAVIANVPGLTASNAAGVVTVSALLPGVLGNRCTLATSNAPGFALSGTALAGGAGATGTPATIHRGV